MCIRDRGQPGFSPLFRRFIEEVGTILGRVMLPQFHISVGLPLVFRQKAERYPLLRRGKDGAGGEVDADAHHLVGRRARLMQEIGQGMVQRVQVILRMLQRPVGPERRTVRQGSIHHGVGIRCV